MRFAILLDHLLNESLPTMDAAAALREDGHVLDGFVEASEHLFWNAARALRPDAVVLPADLGALPWAKSTAEEAKRRLGVPVILCGSAPTLAPERIGEWGVEHAIVGEADAPLRRLAGALARGESAAGIPGVWTPAAPLAAPAEKAADLDALPFPYRGIYQKYPAMLRLGAQRFNATRGAAAQGDSRAKSPERVFEEFRLAAKRTPMRAVHFTDDAFADDLAWLGRFSEVYARNIGLPFSCKGPAASLDKERVEMLVEAKCAGFVLAASAADGLNALAEAAERAHRAGWTLAVEATASTLDEARTLLGWTRLMGAAHARLKVDPRSEDAALRRLADWFALLARPTRAADAAALLERVLPAAASAALLAGGLGERRLRRVTPRAALRFAREAGLFHRRTKGEAGYLP